jgi:hypothetical protein
MKRRMPRSAAMLAVVGVIALALPLLTTGSAQAVVASSAITKSGAGRFASLKVTVDQTQNLIDQVVHISWTGGTATQPTNDSFNTDFLQIFQCWGDAADGPDRAQCQFGGLGGDKRAAQNITTRQVNNISTVVDPNEMIKPPNSTTNVSVPFQSITGEVVTDQAKNSYFDAYSTNELPLTRTRTDAGGEAFMEFQTGQEAPGLGCGLKISVNNEAKKLHQCWLVVVPRDNIEVNGSVLTTGDQLVSSPLSQSNWDQRLVFPLDFMPVELSCPLGAKERQTEGQEVLAEAIGRWQPTLCATTKAVFGFSQVTDDMARTQLEATDPGLVFVSNPAPASDFAADVKPVYAPVAISGLTIAFNIQQQSSPSASKDIQLLNGQRITGLKLNARLVAKLITQSYQRSVIGTQKYLEKNPTRLTTDPEFLALNPDFKTGFYAAGLADVLIPLSGSDAIGVLWNWISSDADAKAFIDGAADPDGMVINPNYKGMNLTGRTDLPKSDISCQAAAIETDPQLCETDFRPYANDMHDAARSASRGDDLARSDLNKTVTPAVYRKGDLQPDGSRDVMALADAATASRYSLVPAQLENASGAFVAPTTESLLAGVAAMKSSDGVLVADPTTKDAKAYPLTTITYGATVPSALDAGERKDYAALLKYVTDAGQTPGIDPGMLPDGYVPLPTSLRTAAVAAADTIATWKDPVKATPTKAPKKPKKSSSPSTPTPAASVPPPAAPATPQPPDSGAVTPTPAATVSAPAPTTAPVNLGTGTHDVVLNSVGLGALGAVFGPALTRFAGRRRR